MSLFPIYHSSQIYSRSEQFLNERASVSGNPSNRTNRFLGWNQISKVVFYRLSRAWFAIRSFLNVRKTWIFSSFRFSKRSDRNRTRLSKKTGFRANIFSSKGGVEFVWINWYDQRYLSSSCKAFVCSLTDVKERFSFSISRIVMLLFRMNFRLVEFWYNSVISFWYLLKVSY